MDIKARMHLAGDHLVNMLAPPWDHLPYFVMHLNPDGSARRLEGRREALDLRTGVRFSTKE